VSVEQPGKTDSGVPSASLPSEGFRGFVSIALTLYLLGFTLTVACNSSSGSSTLLRTVKSKLFSPWMVPLWLDIGFDERLTYGQIDDADYLIMVEPWESSGEDMSIRLPAKGASGVAAARWRQLASWLEPGMVPEDVAGLLPSAMAENLFDDVGAEDVRVRTMRVVLTDREEFSAEDAAEPQYAPVAVARVRRVAGSVQLLPVEQERDVAPVVTPSAEQGATP
jgi:hypothetical protein